MNKKRLVRLLTLILALVLLAGCAAKPATETNGAAAGSKKRVALILEGPISDMGWNATAYEGLKKIEALGAEIKYIENVSTAAVGDTIRSFGEEKYDVIFLSTNSYQDAGSEVAKEYPNVMFFMINSQVTADNVRSFTIKDEEQGFLMGALAAMLTTSGKVGFVGGLPITPIMNGLKGFEQGAKHVKPDVQVIAQTTGSFDDVNAAKELTKAYVAQGVDVVAPMADQSSLGVMQAAGEAGIKAIGSGRGQESVAGNADVVNIIKDTSIAYEKAYESYLAGDMPKEILAMGVAQGVITIGDYLQDVDAKVKSDLAGLYEKLKSGEVSIDLSAK